MAKSRRKAGGATSGRYKPKRMGKGWSAYRAKLGFRPPMVGKETVGKETAGKAPMTAKQEVAEVEIPKKAPEKVAKQAAKKATKKVAKKVAKKSKKPDGDAE